LKIGRAYRLIERKEYSGPRPRLSETDLIFLTLKGADIDPNRKKIDQILKRAEKENRPALEIAREEVAMVRALEGEEI